ncbi:MAG: Crp/Fnr family transcriptional regulator [Chitinophagaceae bacterium]|nr:Crp/Fnr family transcriptional regulator [Chitinophagaceae bacterium]
MEELWIRINTFEKLSAESVSAWEKIMTKRRIKKNEFFVKEGQITRTAAFVSTGLLSQYCVSENGDVITKRFFPKNYFVASMSALLTQSPSMFYIKAHENTSIIEYNFYDFRELAERHKDISSVYIKYLERHWVVEKEPFEISLRSDPAKKRYIEFLKAYPSLDSRLKQHEIASYLGITPTQLSRIRSEMEIF